MRSLALAVFALLPGAAMASGFYLPWWGELAVFLFSTPVGWVALAAIAATVLVLAGLLPLAVLKWVKRKVS